MGAPGLPARGGASAAAVVRRTAAWAILGVSTICGVIVMVAGLPRYPLYLLYGAALLAAAEQIIVDDAAWISLYHYASRALIKPYVKGLERSAQSTAPEFMSPLRKVWLDR